ncbi:MAG: FliA/WhiG family RNA polymerase sigma factor [Verrucomicrobia bacterium]|nr:FliA/WhiG family RNA polymerase sigma factor [Verrucomicrobiota bacterium]
MTTCCLPVALEAPERVELPPSRQELWHRYHHNAEGDEVENDLVKEYLPLVRMVVARVAMNLPSHVSFDDLQSAGLVGLLQAVRNYDPESNCSFETYARLRVRGAVLDELRRMDWAPRSVHEKARKIQEAMAELGQKLGTVPTEAQMAKALGLSLNAYLQILDDIRPATFLCLDTAGQMESGDVSSLYEVVSDCTEDDPCERASRLELAALIKQRMQQLPEMQRKVLALYYYEDLHLREIAEVFGVTESRISQIHTQAILAIRAFLQRCDSGLPMPKTLASRA